MRTPYRTIYHRDGTVTLWDVYAQGWIRTAHPSDAVLASMMPAERQRIMQHTRIINHPAGCSCGSPECPEWQNMQTRRPV